MLILYGTPLDSFPPSPFFFFFLPYILFYFPEVQSVSSQLSDTHYYFHVGDVRMLASLLPTEPTEPADTVGRITLVRSGLVKSC